MLIFLYIKAKSKENSNPLSIYLKYFYCLPIIAIASFIELSLQEQKQSTKNFSCSFLKCCSV